MRQIWEGHEQNLKKQRLCYEQELAADEQAASKAQEAGKARAARIESPDIHALDSQVCYEAEMQDVQFASIGVRNPKVLHFICGIHPPTFRVQPSSSQKMSAVELR
jgi:hypothetical protein